MSPRPHHGTALAALESLRDVESTCKHCEEAIYLDVPESASVPDWQTSDGDFGCDASPESDDESVGPHVPRRRNDR